jgi:tRNA nucleotidyltransferase (CCA-adding enzyme)
MNRWLRAALVFALTGCGGGALYHVGSVSAAMGPQDSYDCVRKQLKAMKYKEESHDDDAHRVIARKENTELAVSATTLRKTFDQLVTEIHADASGTTVIKVEAHSFREYQTARGPTVDEQEATQLVQADASELLKQCQGQAAPKDSLPQAGN